MTRAIACPEPLQDVRQDLSFEALLVTTPAFDVEHAVDVLTGRVLAYTTRVLDAQRAQTVGDAFIAHPGVTAYQTGIPIQKLGQTIFYGDRRDAYFESADAAGRMLTDVFGGARVPDVFENLQEQIARHLAQFGIRYRLVCSPDGREAHHQVLRRWGGAGTELHEDGIQRRLHAGLETQQTLPFPLVSTCVYYGHGAVGDLLIYPRRLCTTDAQLERLDSQRKYGFDPAIVAGLEPVRVKRTPGMATMFRQDCLHIVLPTPDEAVSVTSAGSSAFLSAGEAVRWT